MNNTDKELEALLHSYKQLLAGNPVRDADERISAAEKALETSPTPPTESVKGVKGERPNEKLLIELINKHITGDEYTKYNPALHYFGQVPVEKIADAMEAYAATHPTPESEGRLSELQGQIHGLAREIEDAIEAQRQEELPVPDWLKGQLHAYNTAARKIREMMP